MPRTIRKPNRNPAEVTVKGTELDTTSDICTHRKTRFLPSEASVLAMLRAPPALLSAWRALSADRFAACARRSRCQHPPNPQMPACAPPRDPLTTPGSPRWSGILDHPKADIVCAHTLFLAGQGSQANAFQPSTASSDFHLLDHDKNSKVITAWTVALRKRH